MQVPSAVLTAARWSAIAVPLVDVALVVTGVLDVGTGVAVGLALELLLAAVVLAEVVAFRRGFARARSEGSDRFQAVSGGLGAALPAPVALVVRAELGMARALWWAVRRRRDVEPGDVALPYTDRIGVLLWTTLGLSVLEVAVVHFLVPWPTARWILLAVGLYGLLWVMALAFSLRQHPHVVRAGELQLRFGHYRATRVPLDRLRAARTRVRTGHRRNVELDGGALALSVAGETNVELSFAAPVEVVVKGRAERLDRISFFADDAGAATRLLRAQVLSAER